VTESLLLELLDAGTPPLLVAKVAAELARAEASVEARIAAAMQPTKGALRMRAYRERHAPSQSVTSDAGDALVTESVTHPAPSPSPLPSPCTPNQPHAPTPTREDTPARTRKLASWPCPGGVDPQHWSDLLANRRAKRMALTPTALEHQLRQIEKFTSDEWPPGRIVQHAAAKGWAAIHDPREKHENRNGNRPHQNDRPRSRGLLGAVLDAEHADRAGFGF